MDLIKQHKKRSAGDGARFILAFALSTKVLRAWNYRNSHLHENAVGDALDSVVPLLTSPKKIHAAEYADCKMLTL